MIKTKVDVLGQEYNVLFMEEDDAEKDDEFKSNPSIDGLCNIYDHNIKIRTVREPDDIDITYELHILRHELIHAFIGESGLYANSLPTDAWAINEEMVDFFAYQIPKINKAFKTVVNDVYVIGSDEDD